MMKVAIIGCGKIADEHASALVKIPDCTLEAVCDSEELMAKQLAERYGVGAYFDDVQTMLKTVRPDVVHITTPPQTHFLLATMALDDGAHVFVEKPFTVTTEEAVSRRVVQVGAERRIFRVHAVRFPAEGRPRIGTVAVFHDVTEVARLEAVRRDFVANASHELRTPVAAIRGFAETLLDGEGLSESDRRTYLDTIHRHAIRLGNLVGDLLSLSRIEGRQVESEIEPVDVAALAEVLVGDSRERFAARGLEVALAAPEPAVAWARRQDLEQVLSNLTDNAIHYTDPGGRVDVSVTGDGERVVVRVSDTGIGISPADQERVFERFYRVDAARSRAEGGTGLGLAIVKHLVLAMDGEVTLESEPQRGSTFSVSLRAAPTDAA